MSNDALMAALAAEGLAENVDVNTNAAAPDKDEPADKVGKGTEEKDVSAPDKVDEPLAGLSDQEVEARAKGWNPDKDAYEQITGKKWVSAETFLAKREMADEISRSHKELKKLRKEMDGMRAQFDTRVKAEVDKRLTDLKAERADAIREQDFERINELDDEIVQAEVDKRLAEAKKPDGDVANGEADELSQEEKTRIASALADWKKNRAPWYDKAPKQIRDAAARAEQAYHNMNEGASTEDALNFVASMLEETYPELKAYGRAAPSPGAGRGGQTTTTIDESRLSAQDKDIMRRMEKAGMFKDAKDKQAFIKEALGA